MTVLLSMNMSFSQIKKIVPVEKQKNEVITENVKQTDSKPSEKELNELLYSDAEIESALKFSQEYWLSLKGKSLKDVIETSVEPQQRPRHGKRKTRRQMDDECNPFHIRWWKR